MTEIAELRRLEAEATPGPWRYEIQYGPEGEAIYAWVFTATNELVGTFKIHHAALIVAMRNALPELLKAVEWQPIETAPKDGSPVLAFISDQWIEGMFWNGSAWSYLSDGDTTPNGRHQPTHWMPLPLPPHGGVDVG